MKTTGWQETFLPLMRLQLPEIRDISLPAEGIFHDLILVLIRKSYPLHARKVVWKALNHIDPERDIQFVLGPVDATRHAAVAGRDPHVGRGARAGRPTVEASRLIGNIVQ